MILQALTAYYEELLRQGKISAPGWENKFKVSFQLLLDEQGDLLRVDDLRLPVKKGKKDVLAPQEYPVPAHVKRSSGVAANFLCDNCTYLLGADEKGKPDRAMECFKACAALHHTILDGVDSPAAKALLAYFDRWQPEQAAVHPLIAPYWKDLSSNANLIFCVEYSDGSSVLVIEDPAIRAAWQRYYNASDENSPTAPCLVTGQKAPPAKIHPSIKGIPGAQTSGAALVSFNAPAFCSYGHEQGENAPVSEYAAFAYTTALNLLLSDRGNHCRILGGKDNGVCVVCWAENASSAAESTCMSALFGPPEGSGMDEQTLFHAMNQLAAGKPCVCLDEQLNPDQHIYFLGLSPNAARLSVRFFYRDTLGTLAEHLMDHARALDIVRPAYDQRQNLSVTALAMETVNRNASSPAPAPQLAGDLLRAVLSGGQYPATLLNGVTLRIRAEHEITRGRAAILKAYYTRLNRRTPTLPEEVLMRELNEESCYPPYVLGRLFAVLEAMQAAANPGLNTTIKDRYFNAACATPAIAFPTLIRLAQKHLGKLNVAQATYYSKQMTELVGKLRSEFPPRLTLPEQGAFEIGYYHQTQKRFTKKNEEE